MNDELQHYGVKGMRWGHRKSAFAPVHKERQPDWQHRKSERQKRYEDDNGINSNRPNGTSPNWRREQRREISNAINSYKQRRAEKKAAKELKAKQAAWDKNVNDNWTATYNKAADYCDTYLLPKLNKKYEKMGLFDNPKYKPGGPEYQKYYKEYDDLFNKKFSELVKETFGERPS